MHDINSFHGVSFVQYFKGVNRSRADTTFNENTFGDE